MHCIFRSASPTKIFYSLVSLVYLIITLQVINKCHFPSPFSQKHCVSFMTLKKKKKLIKWKVKIQRSTKTENVHSLKTSFSSTVLWSSSLLNHVKTNFLSSSSPTVVLECPLSIMQAFPISKGDMCSCLEKVPS